MWLVMLALAAPSCEPLPSASIVVPVLTSAPPPLDRYAPLARAIVADASPFELTPEATTFRALHAEAGLRRRLALMEKAEGLIRKAEGAFAELEDGLALELIATATPMLVDVHAEPGGRELFARAHLLAGGVFFARGQFDAAARRLRRAIDLDPNLQPPSNVQLVGALEAVRAAEAQRDTGRLEVELVGTSTPASVWIDGLELGSAASDFLVVPAGRHVLRVAAPGFQSFISTVEILPGRATQQYVALTPDPVLRSIASLGPRLTGNLSIASVQATISDRAKAERTLVSSLLVSRFRGKDANSVAPALLIDLEGQGRRLIDPLDRDALAQALVELGQCEEHTPQMAPIAPPLTGEHLSDGTARPQRQDPPLWLWLGLGIAVLGSVAALAAAQGTNAPPSGADVTLIPRP